MALPLLDGMNGGSQTSWAQGPPEDKLPKRMLVSYFAYGAYMPHGSSGIPVTSKPHHEWSWWRGMAICEECGQRK